jgi:hypothetical protein
LQDFLADLGLGAVADEFGGCAATTDVLLEGAEEFSVRFAAVDVTDLSLSANIELGAGRAVIDGGCIGVDIIRGEWFIAAGDVEGRELCFVVAVEDFTLWHTGILGSFGESTFDSVCIEVPKMRAKAFIVGFMVDNTAFV